MVRDGINRLLDDRHEPLFLSFPRRYTTDQRSMRQRPIWFTHSPQRGGPDESPIPSLRRAPSIRREDRGVSPIHLPPNSAAALPKDIETALSTAWSLLHTDFREAFNERTAVTVNPGTLRFDERGKDNGEPWACLFALHIHANLHGLWLLHCLKFAGEQWGLGDQGLTHFYGRFRVESMIPIDA